jgi:DNA-nicking Smr family endonuclease
LFGGKGEEKKGSDGAGEEDFDAFYRAIDEAVQESVLKEKKQDFRRSRPLSVGERVKAYPRPQTEIDLHGHTSAEAESTTESFIMDSRRKGILTARIIVGKGLHSEKKAILPDVVEAKLIELKRKKWVLDFKWEKKDKRKSGAVIVYIEPL